MGLLSLCLLFTFSLFPTTATANAQAKNLSLATNLGRQVLERQRARAFANVAPITPTRVELPSEVSGVQSTQLFTYQVDVVQPGPEELKDVVVTVSWKVGERPTSLRLQTYVAAF